MSENNKIFEVTGNHLKLFKRTYMHTDRYQIYLEAFGNSDIENDILEILEIDMEGDDGYEKCYSSIQRKFAIDLFQEMPMALQVCLSTGSFKSGLYKSRSSSGFGPHWEKM